MDLAAYYDEYWRRVGDTFDMNRLGLILEHIDAGECVLEVDCGPGVFSQMMIEKGATVEATDMSQVAVDRAREKGISVQRVDLDEETLPYPDNTFEVIVSIRPSNTDSFTTRIWMSASAC